MKLIFSTFIGLLICTSSCTLLFDNSDDNYIDYGDNISLVFDEGLNDNPKYRLPKDENGFYVFELSDKGQNIQRVSVRLLKNDKVFSTKCCGKTHTLEWESNLYWWIMEGDTVLNVTQRYFNPFTGEYQYINLPPLINWREQLVPVVNSHSVTNETTGSSSTVIGPVHEMKEDTLLLTVEYKHHITRQDRSSSFFEIIGDTLISNSIQIILK